MRIAYVEDNPTNFSLVERVSRMAQHTVVSYTEGEIALTALKTEVFDLILMDVELAGEMNGLDLVRELRKGGLTTPIVAVTAYAMLGDREKCIEAGCNEYLPKPLPINDLIKTFAKYTELLKNKTAAAPTPETSTPAPSPVTEPPTVPASTLSPAPAAPSAPVVPTAAPKPETSTSAPSPATEPPAVPASAVPPVPAAPSAPVVAPPKPELATPPSAPTESTPTAPAATPVSTTPAPSRGGTQPVTFKTDKAVDN